MSERGASEEDVVQALEDGVREEGKEGRALYRCTFQFDDYWLGKPFSFREIVPIIAEEPDRNVVITVYVFYFS
jgi:hypothetical protein